MELTLSFNDILLAIYFIIPAYVANSTPIIFGGGKAIDFGKKFIDGERIFGSNKTIRGFFAGILFGFFVGFIEEVFLSAGLFLWCMLISSAALLGDLIGAFIKRRLKFEPGFPLPLMDQLDFVIAALFIIYLTYGFNSNSAFIVLLITPPLHLTTNRIAYFLKLKKAAW